MHSNTPTTHTENRPLSTSLTWEQLVNFYVDLNKESGYTSRHMDYMEPRRMAFLLQAAIEATHEGLTNTKAKQALQEVQTRINATAQNPAQWN